MAADSVATTTTTTVTAVTFAPVQGFISASRKLRDLYGSSLLLSHLARSIAADATARLGPQALISPALVSTSRGTPNQLVIAGDYKRGWGRDALLAAWGTVLDACRTWLEQQIPASYDWQTSWHQWQQHAWEYFHAQGESIASVRERLRLIKQARQWEAINWTGESSTLGGSDAVCRPTMGRVIDPRLLSPGDADRETRMFVAALRAHPALGDAFAGENEQLSLPELVKRLVTYRPIAQRAFPADTLSEVLPERFDGIAGSETTCWFMADGDKVGEHLRSLSGGDPRREGEVLAKFSAAMRRWAEGLYQQVPEQMGDKATVIYAGGDDLLGALHDAPGQQRPLSPDDLLGWLESFPGKIWPAHGQQLTASMGLVWAGGKVPQREALQHVRQAERSAKDHGRDRFALRILFPSGQAIEWVCRWGDLPRVLQGYTDREGARGRGAKWRHLSDDLEHLRRRRALQDSTAAGLWAAYFPGLDPPRQERLGMPMAEWLLAASRVMATLTAGSAR